MNPELQARYLKVAEKLDKLERLRNLVGDSQGTSPRSMIASAVVAAVEFIAAANSHRPDSSIVYRAYEEIFAAVENSPALAELFDNNHVTASVTDNSSDIALDKLVGFRASLWLGDDE